MTAFLKYIVHYYKVYVSLDDLSSLTTSSMHHGPALPPLPTRHPLPSPPSPPVPPLPKRKFAGRGVFRSEREGWQGGGGYLVYLATEM